MRAQLNDVFALCGPIGIGKTTFAKGLVAGLGVLEPVRSQTFTIIKTYDGVVPIHHIDLYRVREIDLMELGAEQLLATDTIAIVEWADRMAGRLPADTVWINFRAHDREARIIDVATTQ